MTQSIVSRAPVWRTRWLRGPTHDLALAFVWVPFALAAHVVADDPGRLRWLVSATLLFSFAHQPLTLWLVYADAAQRRARPSVFAWAPVVVVAVVVVGTSVRPEVVALVAGAWNVAHTLRQRYGLCRLYGRLSGVDCGGDNRLLWAWLAAAVVVALSRVDLVEAARDVGLGRRNRTAVEVLASTRAVAEVLLPLVVGATVVVTVAWARRELRRTTQSPARAAYLGSTFVLLVLLALDPVTGLVAYVGAHAAEYLLVVRWRMARAAERGAPGDGVGALARRVGSTGSLGLYAVAVVALVLGLRVAGGGRLGLTVVLALGTLHLAYDGLIWHSPRPAAPTGADQGPGQGASRVRRGR
jgi:hypothetical protein